MVCDSRLLAKPEGQAVVQKFVEGWMEGVPAARANPDNAVDALVNTEEFFKLLADKEGRPFVKNLFDVVWTRRRRKRPHSRSGRWHQPLRACLQAF